MTTTALANLVLRLDAAANVALAAGVLAMLGRLAEAAGLESGWPLVVLAGVLAANGVLCWRSARPAGRPAPTALRGLAGVDAVFVLAVAWFVVADPTGAATWLRVGLVGLALVVAVVAAAKALLAAQAKTSRVPALR